MTSHCEYLLSYGKAGDFGRFRSDAPLPCRRGSRVVVRSHRGQELGQVMRAATDQHASLLADKFVGQILRLATAGDLELAERMQRKSQSLFEDARAITAELYDRLLAEELAKIRAEYGAERYDGGHFKPAVELFMRMSKSETFDEFLSLPAYELLP